MIPGNYGSADLALMGITNPWDTHAQQIDRRGVKVAFEPFFRM